MGIVRTGESEYDKELEKWNTPRSKGGYGPNGFERFPQMLYKAFRRDNGRVECMEAPPQSHLFLTMPEFLRAEAIAQAFTNKCQHTVRSESEYARAQGEGWRDTSAEAIAHVEAMEREIADAAAEEHFRLKRMSEKARAEHAAANAETDAHVVNVPAPRRKPGRPKAALVTTE